MPKARLIGEGEFVNGIIFEVAEPFHEELFVSSIAGEPLMDRVFKSMGVDWQGVRVYKEVGKTRRQKVATV